MNRLILAVALMFGLLSQMQNAQAAYTGSAPLLVPNGGTGATTLTAHGVLLGEGTGAVVATAVGTNGQMFLGATTADPGWQTMSGDATLGTTGALTIANNAVTNAKAAQMALNTVKANFTSGTANATDFTMPSCADSGGNHLNYVNGTGVTCGTTSGSAIIPTIATAVGASPIAITATNLLTTIVSMGTPAVSTINLPTAVQTAGFRLCVKDGTTNFGTNNATVKSPTSGNIDGVAGATGILMNQAHQELCFISDASNWFVE